MKYVLLHTIPGAKVHKEETFTSYPYLQTPATAQQGNEWFHKLPELVNHL